MNDNEFKRIYNLFKNDIYYLAYSYTKKFDDTDDILQNVFVKLYKNNKIIQQDDNNIKKWLVKVTINECKSLFLSNWKKKIRHFKDYEEENILDKKIIIMIF